jgi:quercetin dioxygenase-like cupin family protein
MIRRLIAVATLFVAALAHAQSAKTGPVYKSPSGATLKLILGDSTIGREVSVGELTFPPNTPAAPHQHGAIEILYVLSGELEHTVNGVTEVLTPGMTGYVRPGGTISHKTGAAGAKVLVVWVPGEEANKIISRWKKEP